MLLKSPMTPWWISLIVRTGPLAIRKLLSDVQLLKSSSLQSMVVMAPKLTTVVSYLIPLLAVYFLVFLPLTQKSSPEEDGGLDTQCDPETLDALTKSLLPPKENISCPEHLYTVHILNRDPLVVYIPHFLSDAEAEHLVDIRYAFWPRNVIEYSSLSRKIVPLLKQHDPVSTIFHRPQYTMAKVSRSTPKSGILKWRFSQTMTPQSSVLLDVQKHFKAFRLLYTSKRCERSVMV